MQRKVDGLKARFLPHEGRIQSIVMKTKALDPLVAGVLVLSLAGCTTHDRSPDQIRQQTAHATSTAVRDAKAVAQGVAEGVKQQRTININKASSDDLERLPGIDEAMAHRIIDHRPYTDSYDLVKQKIISHEEYDRIAGKVEAR
jgi:DNA uptake protein ComE-like DNA-binding protein